MKAYLRLLGRLYPDRELSVVSGKLSALSSQPSDTSSRLITIFKPYDKPKASYHLRPFLLLILVFVLCGAALAQESVVQTTPAAKAEAEIMPLKIGEKIPDELWEISFPRLKTKTEDQQYSKLQDYRNKLIILDFWSIYCGSCIAGFPDIHHLNNKFGDDAVILPVSFEPEERTQAFLDKRPEYKDYNLSFVQGNELLRAYFPFRYVPHEIWIGTDGTFLGATNSAQVNKNSLESYISQGITPNSNKADQMNFDKNKALFVHGNGGAEDRYLYRSIFSEGIEGLPSMTGLDTSFSDKASRYYATNIDLKGLLQPVFPKVFFIRHNLVKYEMGDQSIKDRSFVYELTFPKERSKRWQELVRDDISRYLGITGEITKRTLDAYNMEVDFALLRKMSGQTNALPVENGKSFRDIELRMLINWLTTYTDFPPIVWEHPSDEKFNIDLEYHEWSVGVVIQTLKRYGIELIPTLKEFEVFVIKDAV